MFTNLFKIFVLIELRQLIYFIVEHKAFEQPCSFKFNFATKNFITRNSDNICYFLPLCQNL